MVFDKIRELFTGSSEGDSEGMYFHVKCGKCGTPLRIRVDKRHDLRRDFDQGGYVVDKDLMDSTCFRLFHFTIRFDDNHRIVERDIEGGEFITEEAYRSLTESSTESSAES
jgi:hypothetical protein